MKPLSLRAILLLVILVRLTVAISALKVSGGLSIFHDPDTSGYLAPAKALLAGEFATSGAPEITRTPGYPLLLAAGVGLNQPEIITIAIQILLSSISAYLIFQTGLLLFGSSVAASWGALLYSVEPLSVLFSVKLLSETLFSTLLLLAILLFMRHLSGADGGSLVGSAIAVAASVYVKPAGYYVAFLFALFLMFSRSRVSLRSRLAETLVFLSLSVGLTGLWQLRNYEVAGYPGFSAIEETNLYFYSAAGVRAADEHRGFLDMQRQLGYAEPQAYFAEHPEQRTWTIAQRLAFMKREALGTLRHQPLLYARIHVRGCAVAAFDPDATDYLRLFKRYPEYGGLLGTVNDKGVFATVASLARGRPLVFWATATLALVLVTLWALAIRGLLAAKRNRLSTLFLVTIAVYFVVVSGGPVATGRFRQPIMPLLCLLAGNAFTLGTAKSFRLHSPVN